VANLQPNTFTEVLALAVLTRWGYDGFLKHAERVSEFYKRRRDVFQTAMHRHLSGLVEWDEPKAGMFMWYVS
jgi:tryptophan aminotransferase